MIATQVETLLPCVTEASTDPVPQYPTYVPPALKYVLCLGPISLKSLKVLVKSEHSPSIQMNWVKFVPLLKSEVELSRTSQGAVLVEQRARFLEQAE
jgi:hypothetical protein